MECHKHERRYDNCVPYFFRLSKQSRKEKMIEWVKNVVEAEKLVKKLVEKFRAFRVDYKIEPTKKLKATINAGNKNNLLTENKAMLMALARLESLEIAEKMDKPAGAAGFAESGVEVFVDLSEAIDVEKEKARLQKEIDGVAPYVYA